MNWNLFNTYPRLKPLLYTFFAIFILFLSTLFSIRDDAYQLQSAVALSYSDIDDSLYQLHSTFNQFASVLENYGIEHSLSSEIDFVSLHFKSDSYRTQFPYLISRYIQLYLAIKADPKLQNHPDLLPILSVLDKEISFFVLSLEEYHQHERLYSSRLNSPFSGPILRYFLFTPLPRLPKADTSFNSLFLIKDSQSL